MRNWLLRMKPSEASVRKLAMLAIVAGVGSGAFFMGRRLAQAVPPANAVPATPGATTADYERRVVAYLYENVPVMRAELGEYLIARFGPERLEFLINRKIVEMECAKHGIYVSDVEVDARLSRDLHSFGTPLSEQDFAEKILKRFNKTLYEWREDVIRPKLMMEKLVKDQVHITEKDLQEGFEARYGPKVQCRIIVVDPKGGWKQATEIYENARKSPADFLVEARKQAIPNLAQTEGKVPPIHRYFGDKQMEKTAFTLKDNEIAAPIQMEDKSYVIMMREQEIKPNTNVTYEGERLKLELEMRELRISQKIPEVFAQLRREAAPRPVVTRQDPRGSLLPQGLSPTAPVMPVGRTEVAPPVPQPVTAPGYRPLSVAPQPLPGVNIMPPALLPPISGATPIEKK